MFAEIKRQRACELCERPPEEWELERAKPKRGDPAYIRVEIANQALLMAGSRRGQISLMSSYAYSAFKKLVAAGVQESSVRVHQRYAAERDVLEITLTGFFG